MVMEPECHSEKIVCYLHGQGHNEGSYNQNISVSTVSFELLIHLQTDLVLWNFIISWSVKKKSKKKDCCVQGQGHNETLNSYLMFVQMRRVLSPVNH